MTGSGPIFSTLKFLVIDKICLLSFSSSENEKGNSVYMVCKTDLK